MHALQAYTGSIRDTVTKTKGKAGLFIHGGLISGWQMGRQLNTGEITQDETIRGRKTGSKTKTGHERKQNFKD